MGSATSAQMHGMIVDAAAACTNRLGQVVTIVVADVAPESALVRHDGVDPRDLALTVLEAFTSTRGEYPRQAYLVSKDPYLRKESVRVEGSSAQLALALGVIGDLYGLAPRAQIFATGSVDPAADGKVGPVAEVAAKLEAVGRWLEQRDDPPALVLLPADWLSDDEATAAKAPLDGLRARGANVVYVRTVAEAASEALGEEFAALSGDIAAARQRTRTQLYGYQYADTLAAAERQRELAAALPEQALARRALLGEAVAIGAWAASRRPEDLVVFRGVPVLASEAQQALEAERDALLLAHAGAIWPETRALIENLKAISMIGPVLDFSAGETIASEALALAGVVQGPQGEHRKLLGSRAQLRWRRGLRARQAECDADAAALLDQAVVDAEMAWALAGSPDVDDANDRARVEVYLANALVCRGRKGDCSREGDRARARALLYGLLGVDADGHVVGSPRQEPGWALRVLAWELRHDGPGVLLGRWRAWRDVLRWDGATLQQRMQTPGNGPYREAIAAALAADAIAAGDDEAARTFFGHISAQPNLRSLAWWWPVLQWAEAGHGQVPELYRQAIASQFAEHVERPAGPCRDRSVTNLLHALASADPATATGAWRNLTMWIGEPDPVGDPAP